MRKYLNQAQAAKDVTQQDYGESYGRMDCNRDSTAGNLVPDEISTVAANYCTNYQRVETALSLIGRSYVQ